MVTKVRLFAAMAALVMALLVAGQHAPHAGVGAPVQLRYTSVPMTGGATTDKPPVSITNPRPFDPCEEIPFEAVERIGLAFSPPIDEEALRCHYDAGNYQVAVEAIIWRTYAQTLPADAVETDINGHRAAQYWVMKPTDWNNRWWVSCMVTFKTSYGAIQQSLFYAPTYSESDVDCPSENLRRAYELSPYYKF